MRDRRWIIPVSDNPKPEGRDERAEQQEQRIEQHLRENQAWFFRWLSEEVEAPDRTEEV